MIRVLVVDDSSSYRVLLRELLERDPELKVVGEATDGLEAVALARQLRPDVITMDVRMPRKDGLSALTEIMRDQPIPVVVVCAQDGDKDVGFQALKLGAVEVLAKGCPERQLQQTVKAMAGVKLVRRIDKVRKAAATAPEGRRVTGVVAIAASTGGPAALSRVLSALPAAFPLPVLVVQHIVDGFTEGLVTFLARQCALPVRVAEEGELIKPGAILVAPDRRHLMVAKGQVRLDDGPPVKSLRPSATILFAAVAREYAANAVGVILTGMGSDGASGLKLMRDRGAVTLGQSQGSCVVYGMPKEAVELGAVERVLDLEEIGPHLLQLTGVNGQGEKLPAPARRKLLLVDDTETILQFEQAELSGSYELVLARNGQEALEQAELQKPDLILMDYTMPVMTGGEALKQLRERPATRRIPVIMVTSETDPALIRLCWDFGCQDFVPKPIDRTVLHRAVKKWAPQ